MWSDWEYFKELYSKTRQQIHLHVYNEQNTKITKLHVIIHKLHYFIGLTRIQKKKLVAMVTLRKTTATVCFHWLGDFNTQMDVTLWHAATPPWKVSWSFFLWVHACRLPQMSLCMGASVSNLVWVYKFTDKTSITTYRPSAINGKIAT